MEQDQQMDPELRGNTTGVSLSEVWDGKESLTEDKFLSYLENQDYYLYILKLRDIICLLQMLLAFCGLAGNGVVIWLLGFCIKRKPFSVYIFNLACADFTFLLFNCIVNTTFWVQEHSAVFNMLTSSVELSSFVVGVCLLTAISTERCVSVLYPIWYRCHRPAHLSSILCAVFWGLALCAVTAWHWCIFFVDSKCYGINLVYNGLCILTFLVLFVSGVTLLIRVQCGSRRRQTTRLYVTILINVLAFLLLNLPFSVYHMIYLTSVPLSYYTIDVHIFRLLMVLNSGVNPIIYFFVGRYRQPHGRKALREVLQSALNHEEEAAEQRGGIPVPRERMILPGTQSGQTSCNSTSEL
ncbi:mas-related G-protein coupled receptor member A2-like [Erinaceus europaeus]|uniref:Mas-related G-protein coupled receptor member A2-like n=1 Tax=Erinaceus europaeus TaxID=9365 RepID=A0A1S2ZI34_ERIEU|nr:mas-related G-protein coupled receptor member A2-like [Erinaceus europaeus]XP_060033434.1 mas-related G-protein coupled receptor member A2-like [Erinaceus europaeus]